MPVLTKKSNTVCAIHDLVAWDCPETMPLIKQWYFRISQKSEVMKGAHVVTISDFSKSRIEKKFNLDSEDIWTVYCGVDSKFVNYRPSGSESDAVKRKYGLPDSRTKYGKGSSDVHNFRSL
jgi:glycosyltransferase involved in cell wall biosynthesis